MKKEYDFSKMQLRKNSYAKLLKKPVTIRISVPVVAYFKELALEKNIPYQNLINLYLLDCIEAKRKIDITWK